MVRVLGEEVREGFLGLADHARSRSFVRLFLGRLEQAAGPFERDRLAIGNRKRPALDFAQVFQGKLGHAGFTKPPDQFQRRGHLGRGGLAALRECQTATCQEEDDRSESDADRHATAPDSDDGQVASGLAIGLDGRKNVSVPQM